MLTDRLNSGPSQLGNSNFLQALNRRSEIRDKGPESFQAVVDKKTAQSENEAKTPQPAQHDVETESTRAAPGKPDVGRKEAGPRMERDLSVKRKNTGERAEKAAENAGEKSENDVGDDASDGKTESKKAKSEGLVAMGKPKRILSQRQKVMQEFMDSMESEFRVPPEKIVGAMAKLNNKEMLSAPEDTASQVIQKLGLEPQQADRAEMKYASMLVKLSNLDNHDPEKMLQPTGEQLAWMQASGGGIGGMAHMATLKPAVDGQAAEIVSVKNQRAMLNDSIGRLSQKFFNNEPRLAPTANQSLQNVETQAQNAPFNPMLAREGENVSEMIDDETPQVDLSQIKQQMPGMKPPVKMSEEGYQDLAAKLAVLGISAGALGEAIKADPKNMAALKMEQSMQGPSAGGYMSQANGPGFTSAQMMSMSHDSGDSSFGSSSEGGDTTDLGSSGKGTTSGGEFFAQQPQIDGGKMLVKSDMSAAQGMGQQNPATRGAEANQNIHQIMNQAQYMIKKGGGESIVRLSPEGLGDIHMRVSVADGKVNLQMSAETKEAKNLIENSMHDLKASLGAHNLKIEHVKVDVGNQASADTGAHKGNEFKFDQGREQTRQFLNNFQDDNSANRGNFFESPALKAYRPHHGPEPLKPSPESAKSSRYVGEGRGQGLNVVA